MLIIHDTVHSEKVRAFAQENDITDKLQLRLDYLAKYSDRHTRCHLYPDSSPNSWEFTMEVQEDGEWRYWFNGGLIYHEAEKGWGVHT